MSSHLDDEALSALLDGEAHGDARDHVGVCDRCGDRLDQLESAAGAVAVAPRAPTPPRRDAMVDAALAAAAAAGPTAPSSSRAVPSAGNLRVVRRRPWLVAAAAVLVLGVAVPVVTSQLDSGSDVGDLGAGDVGSEETSAPSGDGVDGADGASPVVLGDLGEVDLRSLAADGALEELVRGRAEHGRAQAPGAEEEDAAPAPLQLRPSDDEPASAAPPSAVACEPTVRTHHPDLARLAFVATGTVAGDAVALLGFEIANPAAGAGELDRVVVVERRSCTELTTLTVEAAP